MKLGIVQTSFFLGIENQARKYPVFALSCDRCNLIVYLSPTVTCCQGQKCFM